jgi:hypothetical protein
MIHLRSDFTRLALLVALVSASALVAPLALAAGLKDKAPEGLKLDGTEWQLDPYNSDDASEAVDRAARKMQQQKQQSGGREVGGGIFGGDDPLGGRHGPGDSNRSGRFPSDRDTSSRWPPDGRGSTDIDPTGGGGAVTMQWGTARGSIFFESLRTNPAKLGFSEGKQYVTVTADGLETECEPGAKAPFSDSYGDGERTCGWNGRAWVVETKRGRQFSRTDRYELSKDGRTLRYTTSASEEGIGRVTISRKYQIPIAK